MTLRFLLYVFMAGSTLMISACNNEPEKFFARVPAEHSNISFVNEIDETPEINIMNYEYTYNGGGVAAGDFNNDGLCDLYFTGNAVSNKLYLNLGDLKFKDVTDKAGVGGRGMWKTGVTAADVNGDGWLDLYVCYSGPDAKQSLSNQLFINNGGEKGGETSFSEKAVAYGLDAPGTYSTQAAFFDYDRDGDLDMILINHGNHFYSPFINTNKLRNTRHPNFGNRLYRNDTLAADSSSIKQQPHFTEVSEEAGIHGGGINFSLGVSISDLNNDNWPDIYVTNDYEEQDFLYLNNHDGTFTDCTKKSFGHFSRNGMGTDAADYNNDGRVDLMELDMWPEDNYRQKLLKGPDDFTRYTLMVDSGFHFQQMRNTLQLNAGSSPDGAPIFCEVGQLAGVAGTDWSWSTLFADFDNDGFKDIFVTNGYLRDFTSLDFLKYTVEEAKRKAQEQGTTVELYDLVSKMPSTKTRDYVFRNNGDLTFSDQTVQWGMDIPNLSFGAAYADLDNDGDLEVITNNTNEQAFVWKNNANTISGNNYLRIQLQGSVNNTFGAGAKIFIEREGSTCMNEQFSTRGFQSSVDPILHVGLGKNNNPVSVKVLWPDGKQSMLTGIAVNQLITISYAEAKLAEPRHETKRNTLFSDISKESKIRFVHHENEFNDFDREPLIPYQLSRMGPALASGDVNGDGNDDFFMGGASGQSGQLYLSDGGGRFSLATHQPWKEDLSSEDTGALFFDADGDGDNDLFVVSGGTEFMHGAQTLDDRLYLNQDDGKFVKAPAGTTVADHVNGSCVASADYDRDGDIDLFVGGGTHPGSFPKASPGAILRNETDRNTRKVKFVLATKEVNPDLREPGIVTDALWTDFNHDGWPDLLVVGHWMPIMLFENMAGKLKPVETESLSKSTGLWNKIAAVDFDDDGDIDYIIGNAGTNLPWKISDEEPLTIYASDFNDDGRLDPILCYTASGKEYPVASRDEIFSQVNSLRKKFTNYAAYADASIEKVFDKAALDKAQKLNVSITESVILENTGNGNFKVSALPISAQLSSVLGIVAEDFNDDGLPDILLSGNFYSYRTQFGRSDASMGLFLTGDGHGKFAPVQLDKSGFVAAGDVRDMSLLKGENGRKFILLARNNDSTSLFDIK